MKGKRQTSLRHVGYLLMEAWNVLFIAMSVFMPFLFFSVIRKTGANLVQMLSMSVVCLSVPAMAACWLMMADARRREWLATGTVGRDGPWSRWRRRGFIVWCCCIAGLAFTTASFWRQILANLP